MIAKYVDSRLQIVQADGDGGDSLNRIGCYGSCGGAPELVHEMLLSNSEGLPPGRYCRNPKPGAWYSNMNNVTRDQMLPVEAYWALSGDFKAARAHFKLRAKRAMFHFSEENDGYDSGAPLQRKLPDIMSPAEACIIIRAGQYKSLYFLLPILDLALIFDVLVTRRISDRNLYDFDNQFLPTMLACSEVQPTKASLYAKKLYAKTDAPERIRAYHAEGPGKNGIEPLGKIMEAAFYSRIAK